MTRLWTGGQEIVVERDARGNLVSFTWEGHTYFVQTVHERWQADTDWWSVQGRVYREYLTVTTTNGLLCVLYCDFLDEQWYLAKVYD